MNLGFALYYRVALCPDPGLEARLLTHLRDERWGLNRRRDDRWTASFYPRLKKQFARVSLNLGAEAMEWNGPYPYMAYGWVEEGGDEWVVWVRELAALLSPVCGIVCAWPTRDQVVSDASLVKIDDGLPEPFAAQCEVAFRLRRLIGEKARHPRWGTFLHTSLVERIGGLERCKPLASLVEQEGELVYIQLTASPSDDYEERRRALEALMSPILL